MNKALALGVALTLATLGWASTYVRPQIAYVIPEESSADSTVGLFAAVGYSPSAHGAHEFELELGWADWDLAESATVDGFSYVGEASYEIVPLMVNYRYSANVMEKAKGYFQVGGGVARVSTTWDVLVSDGADTVSVQGDDSETTAAFSIGVGMNWSVGEHTTFNLGYRYLRLATFDIELTDTDRVHMGDTSSHIVEAGFSFSF